MPSRVLYLCRSNIQLILELMQMESFRRPDHHRGSVTSCVVL
jgi:hypothetical protein